MVIFEGHENKGYPWMSPEMVTLTWKSARVYIGVSGAVVLSEVFSSLAGTGRARKAGF